jgi:protein subunit release factor A|tara:strand:+ start:25 stop:495 length:471 start_codon:yes stop_codon:yes gene_type:complete
MIIYKLQQQKTNKVYVGYSVNDNPNNFGTGKYIKRAVKDFGTTAFKREVLEIFNNDESLSDVLKRVEYWISKFKSDNSKYGFNETVQELIPQRKRLTKKIQVLLTPEDEDSLNAIIIQRSMDTNIKPVAISKYVRQLIVEHIVKETTNEKQLIKNN